MIFIGGTVDGKNIRVSRDAMYWTIDSIKPCLVNDPPKTTVDSNTQVYYKKDYMINGVRHSFMILKGLDKGLIKESIKRIFDNNRTTGIKWKNTTLDDE